MRISESVHDSFVRANAGLEQRNEVHDPAMENGRRTLELWGCTRELLLSDTLRAAFGSIQMGVDSLKRRMLEMSASTSAPADYEIPDKAYDVNGTGDRLHKDLEVLFHMAARLMAGDPQATEVARLGRMLEEPPPPETWRVRNFHSVPMVASIAVLSKFQSNAAAAEALCMDKLLRNCAAQKP